MANELDPSERLEVDQLQEQYQRRYGVSVEFIKSAVGQGDEYCNQAARAVISPAGAWFECVDLQMEFSGGVGEDVSYRFVSDAEALRTFNTLHNAEASVNAENSRRYSLFALYAKAGIADGRSVYAFQFELNSDGVGRKPQLVGAYRPGALPLVFRVRMDTDIAIPNLTMHRGVTFCLTGIGERNLVVTIPYTGDDVRDLGDAPDNPMTQ